MTEDGRGIDSRKDWVEFIDMLIGLTHESTNRFSNRYWLVLPLLVTVGWATLQFVYSARINLEIFAVSLLFLSLISLATMAASSLIPPPSDESEPPRTIDYDRESKVTKLIVAASLTPPSISVLAIVLLWRDFNNMVGYVLLGVLVFLAVLMLVILCWEEALKAVVRSKSTSSSRRSSRVPTAFLTYILLCLAIAGLAWNELWRDTWFLSFELAVLEGGVVLGVFSMWFFSLAREFESGRLGNLITLRYEITRRGLDAEEIAKIYAGGVEALSRLSQRIDEPSRGIGGRIPRGK